MATYTAVLVTPNELEQDDVIEMLERIGVVAFCGPGSLVESIDPDGTEADGMATVPDAATVGLDGLRVHVQVAAADDGPLLSLYGENCGLEGELPGEYYLTSINEERGPDVPSDR